MQHGIEEAGRVLEMAEIELTFWPDDVSPGAIEHVADLVALALNICNQFYLAAHALREHGRDRAPLLIEDEYDVQYLMES
jgi:hypothetical protein